MTTITSKPDKAPHRRSLARLLGTHFWPHRNWFIGGTIFAVITSISAVGYAGVLAYVGNAIQCQLEGGSGNACQFV